MSMAMELSCMQLNGEVMLLEVTPETTGRELKRRIKARQLFDELKRLTTRVDLIVGDLQAERIDIDMF